MLEVVLHVFFGYFLDVEITVCVSRGRLVCLGRLRVARLFLEGSKLGLLPFG